MNARGLALCALAFSLLASEARASECVPPDVCFCRIGTAWAGVGELIATDGGSAEFRVDVRYFAASADDGGDGGDGGHAPGDAGIPTGGMIVTLPRELLDVPGRRALILQARGLVRLDSTLNGSNISCEGTSGPISLERAAQLGVSDFDSCYLTARAEGGLDFYVPPCGGSFTLAGCGCGSGNSPSAIGLFLLAAVGRARRPRRARGG